MQPPTQIPAPRSRWSIHDLDLDLDDDWDFEIEVVEAAIDVLLRRVRRTREEDFRMETVLWRRHHERLWTMKRKLDAVVM